MNIKNYRKLSDSEAQLLVEDFMNGTTSPKEEQMIYDYFLNGDISEELLPERNFFLAMMQLGNIRKPANINKKGENPKSKLAKSIQLLSKAASVAILFVLTFAAYNAYNNFSLQQYAQRYSGSYIVINGERNDNLREIRPQIEKALSMAEHLEARLETAEQNEKIKQ